MTDREPLKVLTIDIEQWSRGGRFPTTTRLARPEVDALLADFEVELFREEEADSITSFGVPKHRHLYDVVARKPT